MAGSDDVRLVVFIGPQNVKGRRIAEQRGHPPVVCRGGAAALDVTERCDANVLAKPIGQQIAHVSRMDRVALAVLRALGHHDDGIAAPGGPAGVDLLAQFVLP